MEIHLETWLDSEKWWGYGSLIWSNGGILHELIQPFHWFNRQFHWHTFVRQWGCEIGGEKDFITWLYSTLNPAGYVSAFPNILPMSTQFFSSVSYLLSWCIYIYIQTQYKIYPYIYNIKHVVDKMIYLCQTRASLYLNIPCPWPLSRLQQRIISAKYWPRCTAAKCELYRAFEGPEAPLNVATPSTPKRPGSVHPLPTWKRWSSLARCDFL
jgi:hypothetical protein